MLFGKDKDLILKICNGILLLWLIAALVFTASSIIEKVVPERSYTYSEYKIIYCRDKITVEEDCKNNYDMDRISNKNQGRYKDISLYSALSNVIIVSIIIFIINKKKVK